MLQGKPLQGKRTFLVNTCILMHVGTYM